MHNARRAAAARRRATAPALLIEHIRELVLRAEALARPFQRDVDAIERALRHGAARSSRTISNMRCPVVSFAEHQLRVELQLAHEIVVLDDKLDVAVAVRRRRVDGLLVPVVYLEHVLAKVVDDRARPLYIASMLSYVSVARTMSVSRYHAMPFLYWYLNCASRLRALALDRRAVRVAAGVLAEPLDMLREAVNDRGSLVNSSSNTRRRW